MGPFESSLFNQKTIRTITFFLVGLMVFTLVMDFILVILFPNSPEFLQEQFNLDMEGNWATWFNGTLALIAGIAAVLVGLLMTHERFFISRWTVAGWLFIGGVLTFIGLDDQIALHDKFRPILRRFLNSNIENFPDQIGFYAWYVVLAIPAGIAAIIMLRFLYKHAWRFTTARHLIIAGFILLASNPITEVLEDLPSKVINDPSVTTKAELIEQYPFVTTWGNVFILIQEMTEMLGLILLAAAFLHVGRGILAEAQPETADSSIVQLSRNDTSGAMERPRQGVNSLP